MKENTINTIDENSTVTDVILEANRRGILVSELPELRQLMQDQPTAHLIRKGQDPTNRRTACGLPRPGTTTRWPTRADARADGHIPCPQCEQLWAMARELGW